MTNKKPNLNEQVEKAKGIIKYYTNIARTWEAPIPPKDHVVGVKGADLFILESTITVLAEENRRLKEDNKKMNTWITDRRIGGGHKTTEGCPCEYCEYMRSLED